MIDLTLWAPLVATAGLMFCLFELLGTRSPMARATGAALSIAMILRYTYWRLLYSLPLHQTPLQRIWPMIFLAVELGSLLSSMMTTGFLSRTVNRSTTADARQGSPLLQAPTDVFIATYNESRDILERTMVGALAIEHPDHRVWVLDDGNRAWVRELAESLGVFYVARVKGKHAKAGNVNNGVKQALSTGRRPQFFLLLDADFVAHRKILRRTLGLFEDGDVGIVQTPQHFFNPDPVQNNLLCSTVWPDEQRFFFNALMPCKDAWGAAFCCGTSAVFRVAAFEAAGGMATETVTEDMLTTFKFGEFGYRTIFLNERLSLGLSPESLVDFISQRARWCLGAVQQIYTRWSFFGRGRVSLVNRISFFDSLLFWIFGAVFRLMLLAAPLVYWFTGTAALHATMPDLLQWMAPMVVANIIFMAYAGGNRILPIMTDVTQLMTAFVICRTVATGLIRPFGRPFKVTAKGLSTTSVTVQWKLLWPFALMAVLTMCGFLLNSGQYSPVHGSPGYDTLVLWTFVNTGVLLLASLTCVEMPHRRRDERFAMEEPARVRLRGFSGAGPWRGPAEDRPEELTDIACTVQDLSLGGAALVSDQGWKLLCGPASLVLASHHGGPDLELPFRVLQRRGDKLTLQFEETAEVRHALIRKLFTGQYHREVESIHAVQVFGSVGRLLFADRARVGGQQRIETGATGGARGA